jgi:hypothetical protein
MVHHLHEASQYLCGTALCASMHSNGALVNANRLAGKGKKWYCSAALQLGLTPAEGVI